MDYLEIIKKTWNIIKKYRFLWWLGILAALTEVSVGFNIPSPSTNGIETSNWNSPAANLGSQINEGTIILIVALLLVAFIGIGLVMLFVSLTSNAGLIHAVFSIDSGDHKDLSFGRSFAKGIDYFWRFLALKILISLVPLGLFIAFGILAVFLLFTGGLFSVISLPVLIIAGILIILPLGIYLSLIELIGRRQIVSKNKGVIISIEDSHHIIVKNFGPVLILWLIRTGFGIAYFIAIFIALFVLLTPVGLLGFLIYSLAHWTGVIIYGVIALILITLALIFLGGTFTSFTSGYWTLGYKELKKT